MPAADERDVAATAPGPSGVIHDIGYRHYDGPRLGSRYIQRSLYLESLKGAYGFGRSAKSKIMPLLLLAAMCLPALVVGIVASVFGATELPIGYADYLYQVQVVVTIFLGAQAPVVVSRDFRFRVLPLYLSRPMERVEYLHAKLAAMVTAVLLLLALPVTILFAGALLAEIPWQEQLPDYLRAMGGAVLYAVVLSPVVLLIAAMTPRRGFGVAAVVAVLLVLSGVQSFVRALAGEFGRDTLVGYAGLLSPYSLVDGLVTGVLRAEGGLPAPPDVLGPVVFAAVAVLLVGACYVGLRFRYRRAATS